jgi:aspartyl-tRNA(Asn)/glutamyl-tRNA(Gln) amidotransferase subunit B
MAELLNLIGTELISGRIAKKVFEEMADGLAPDGPKAYVEKRGMIQVTDTTEIRKLIGEIIDQHTSQVNEYLSGQEKIFGFFVGQVMRRSGGRMNPQVVNDLLKEMLNARRSG